MSSYTAMFQYSRDTFSVIHPQNSKVYIGDEATVYHKTALHKPNRNTHNLKIIEILETRNHRTDSKSLISKVRCEEQI